MGLTGSHARCDGYILFQSVHGFRLKHSHRRTYRQRLHQRLGQFNPAERVRASILDPYLPFVRQTLEADPRLRATRLHWMLRV